MSEVKVENSEPGGRAARRRQALRAVLRWGLALVTVASVAAVAYFALVLVSPTDFIVGPVKLEFRLQPAWHGKSVIDLPPAGSLEADTHAGPALASYTLKEITVTEIDDLTDPDSTARQELQNWQEPVRRQIWSLLARALLVTTLAGGLVAAVMRRCWRWSLAGAAVGLIVSLGIAGLAYGTYDSDAFNEPRFSGGLTYAPELIEFSQTTLANLESYQDRVPEIAQSLYNTVNELHQLPATTAPEEDTVRVLHISDMHNSIAGANLVKRVVDLYNIDFVIDTGDLTELGLPWEVRYPLSYLPLSKPYLWVAGNHETPTISEAMKGIKGVTVLDGQPVDFKGVPIVGFADPASQNLSPDPVSEPRMKEEAARIAMAVEALPVDPFIVAVHDPKQAARLVGKVPLIVNGHTHRQEINIVEGTVVLDAGSTGGGGFRSFENKGEQPSTLQVLYLKKNPLKLVAVDSVTIFGYSQEFSVARRVFGPQEGEVAALLKQPAATAPVPSLSRVAGS